MSKSTKINWKQFSIKNENQTEAFEDLCYHLFCRKYKLAEGVRVDFNQVGLETYPIIDKKGDLTGFQAKYFDNKLSDASSISQIKNSISKAKKNYIGLKKIIIYTHQSFGSTNPAYKKKIETFAAPIKIDWFVESNFQATLFRPANLDLAQIYFGLGTEIEFIKETLNPKSNTFLSSSLYLYLPINEGSGKEIKMIKDYILNSSVKEFLLIGNPGSGKSMSIYKLFQELAGLHRSSTTTMIHQLTKQKAIPVLINLRNCNTDSIENIIRGRQNDNNLKGKSLNFIYLFDGLDELTEQKVEEALSYILELKYKTDTDRIIFSCRSGSLNRLKAKAYFNKISELRISNLKEKHIDTYFAVRADTLKSSKLKLFKLHNPKLLHDIQDILLLNLLWETIDKLDTSSTVMDLLAQKIELLIHSPMHKKDLDSLNLLNPKEAKVISLQEEIAYEFQKKFQFRFTLSELQKLIIKECSLQDYISVNKIINYLCSLFFDFSHLDNQANDSYVYQHRRYQEYFFVKKLRWEYERNPKVLRELNVISNADFFENFFLLFLKTTYKKENNLIGLIELNLIDVYLGKHRGWGADRAYYLDSKEFIISIAGQTESVFEQLVHDENFGLADKIFLNVITKEKLETLFEKFFKDKRDSDTEQHLRYIWENDLAQLIDFAAILHQNGKTEQALKIKKNISNIIQIYENHKFITYSINKSPYKHLQDPFWTSWEAYLYNWIVINGEELENVYQNRISVNYKNFNKNEDYSYEESGKEKLVKSFLRVALNYKVGKLTLLLKKFNEDEFSYLLSTLCELKYLPVFYRDVAFQKAVINRLATLFKNKISKDLNVLFFKKITGFILLKEEMDYTELKWKDIKKQSEFDLQLRNQILEFVIASYIKEIYHFDLFLKGPDKEFNYYYETGLFASLFHDYILFLKKEKDIQNITREYTMYIKKYTRNGQTRKHFVPQFSEIWAILFNYSEVSVEKKKKLKELLFSLNDNINKFDFNLTLKRINPDLAAVIISKDELKNHASELTKSNDNYWEYINKCFKFALLHAGVNDSTSIKYISKGINDGILRHGWRKDPIVSYNLVDSLDILWRNGWSNKSQLKLYSKKVFDLTVKVTAITDGKITWKGPYNLIAVVAKHDLPLAVKFRDRFIRKHHNYNISLNTPIIKEKINSGIPLEEIEKVVNSYRHDYDHKGRLSSEYHLERFKAYLHIASSMLHPDDEQKMAFNKAHDEISEMLTYEDYHVNWENELKKEKDTYKELCVRYNVEYKIPPDMPKDYSTKKSNLILENKLIKKLDKIKTQLELIKWYSTFRDRESITVTTFEHWIKIVDKTYGIMGNVSLLLDLMKRDYFPHSDYFSYNSKYYYLGLAAALKNLNTKQQTLDYLMDNSGHGGFLHIMESYEVLRDEDMCTSLFERFIKMSDFLVN